MLTLAFFIILVYISVTYESHYLNALKNKVCYFQKTKRTSRPLRADAQTSRSSMQAEAEHNATCLVVYILQWFVSRGRK